MPVCVCRSCLGLTFAYFCQGLGHDSFLHRFQVSDFDEGSIHATLQNVFELLLCRIYIVREIDHDVGHGGSFFYKAASAAAATSAVRSMSAFAWAMLMKPVSNWLGAK